MDQQAKYGTIPEERSKTAQGNPGTRCPPPHRPPPDSAPDRERRKQDRLK